MLLRFTVSNHASIRDKQVLSFVATDRHDNLAVRRIPNEDVTVLPVVGIFGANASGKSNVMDAFTFMARAVVNSHQQWQPFGSVPRRPFLFDDASRHEDSKFVVDFAIDGIRHRYGFRCNDFEFLEEWLFTYPEQRRRLMFHRVPNEPVKFGTHFTGHRKLIETAMRPNSLYLSTAAANNHAELSRVYEWFSSRTIIANDENAFSRLEHTVEAFKDHRELILALLEFADMEIVDLEIRRQEYTQDEREALAQLIRVLSRSADSSDPSLRAVPDILVVHQVQDRLISLPLRQESSGTRTWLGIVGAIADVLKRGSLLVVDELDARLHSTLAGHLVRLFQEKAFNKHGAQLFFNSHDTTLFSKSAPSRLRRDQIWFTAKEDGATVLYPLTEYRVREGVDNVEASYLRGRYGAVPVINETLVAHL